MGSWRSASHTEFSCQLRLHAFDGNDSSVEEDSCWRLKYREAVFVAFSLAVAANHSKNRHSGMSDVLKIAFSLYCRLPMRSQNNAKNFRRPPLLLQTCSCAGCNNRRLASRIVSSENISPRTKIF
jgi:hypothetical protein